MPKMPQMDLIAELKKRQMNPLVREGKDGAIEDIITGKGGFKRTDSISSIVSLLTFLS